MATQVVAPSRPRPRKRSFIRRVVPKFFRRSRRSHPMPSFVVQPDAVSLENWNENDDLLQRVCQDGEPPVNKVFPTNMDDLDGVSNSSDEITENYLNTIKERRNRQDRSPSPRVDPETTAGNSCVGTIKIKLTENDAVQEPVLKTLLSSNNDSQTRIEEREEHDFPFFSTEVSSEILTEAPEFQPESLHVVTESHAGHVTPISDGVVSDSVTSEEDNSWGFVLAGVEGYKSKMEAMLLLSSLDEALVHRNPELDSGWGFVFRPEAIGWQKAPFKKLGAALWDILSACLVSSVFLVTATAVSMVIIWQCLFSISNLLTSLSQLLATSHKKQNLEKLRKSSVTLGLPPTKPWEFNPCKKFMEALLKPFLLIGIILMTPILVLENIFRKFTFRRGISKDNHRQFSSLNIFSRIFKLPHMSLPRFRFRSIRSGRSTRTTSTRATSIRTGTVWGRNSGGSRSCHCRCRKCIIS